MADKGTVIKNTFFKDGEVSEVAREFKSINTPDKKSRGPSEESTKLSKDIGNSKAYRNHVDNSIVSLDISSHISLGRYEKELFN